MAAGGCWRRHGHAGAGQLGHAVAGRRAADLGPGGEENAGWRDALYSMLVQVGVVQLSYVVTLSEQHA